MRAIDISLVQYRLTKLPSKLADAIRMLELVIEIEVLFYGENSPVTAMDRKLHLRLK